MPSFQSQENTRAHWCPFMFFRLQKSFSAFKFTFNSRCRLAAETAAGACRHHLQYIQECVVGYVSVCRSRTAA